MSVPAMVALVVGAGLAIASCSATNGVDPREAILAAQRDRLAVEIVGLIGDAACSDSTACRAIAFGAKPCGGPREYLAYSAATVDTLRLRRLVEQYNAVDHTLNRIRGAISDCRFVLPPRVGCVEGRCVELPQTWAGDTRSAHGIGDTP